MSGILFHRLRRLAATQEPDMRDRIQSALMVGAELALARVREVGGTYSTLADLETVTKELDPTDHAPIVIHAPAPDDEAERMAV